MLYCGFGKCDITPELGMDMPGYTIKRVCEGVFDPLYAKAIVFENGENICALVVLDLEQLDRSDVFDIRYKAQAKCGIWHENIFVWATHTHAGGPVDSAMNSCREKEYINAMTEKAAQAICDAYNNRRPAKIGSATGEVKNTAFIRRFLMKEGGAVMNPAPGDTNLIGPEGEPDETYTVARVEDAETGKIMGFISSFGLHLDTIGMSSASADYPGALAELVRKKYGDDVNSVFFTGPCGNTNHFDLNDITTRDGSTMRFRIAEKLFAELCRLDGEITCADADVEIRSRRFLEPLRCVNQDQIDWAKDILAGVKNDLYDDRFKKDIFAKPILKIAERIEETVEIEISAVQIGGLKIISWPGEVFVEFGMEIRDAFPGEDIIIGELGGGSVVCYICTHRGIENGSYEPMAASALCLEPDGGYNIVKETFKMLKK